MAEYQSEILQLLFHLFNFDPNNSTTLSMSDSSNLESGHQSQKQRTDQAVPRDPPGTYAVNVLLGARAERMRHVSDAACIPDGRVKLGDHEVDRRPGPPSQQPVQQPVQQHNQSSPSLRSPSLYDPSMIQSSSSAGPQQSHTSVVAIPPSDSRRPPQPLTAQKANEQRINQVAASLDLPLPYPNSGLGEPNVRPIAREKLPPTPISVSQQGATTVSNPAPRSWPLNPNAPVFNPPFTDTNRPLRETLPSGGGPTMPDTTHLVYTHIHHRESSIPHLPHVILPLLRALPAHYFREDGSVDLSIQWVISQVGYAHFEPGPSGRAILTSSSWLRNEGTAQHGLPARFIQWLTTDTGGGVLHVPSNEAKQFLVYRSS